jgi:hypothetical protein
MLTVVGLVRYLRTAFEAIIPPMSVPPAAATQIADMPMLLFELDSIRIAIAKITARPRTAPMRAPIATAASLTSLV